MDILNMDALNVATQTKDSQSGLTPENAIQLLKAGNQRFMAERPLNRNLTQQINDTSTGQYPFAVVLSCIDSRIPTEIIFDQGIGDIFNARIAGNFINDDILGSMEFGCKLAGSKVIVVMGHTACGAVKGACDHAELGLLTQMLDKIMPAVDSVKTEPGVDRSSKNIDFVNRVSAANVEIAIQEIKSRSTVLKEMEDDGEIAIIGAMYDIKTGKVSFH